MSRTISQHLDEVKHRVESLESDLYDANAEIVNLRETLRRVVVHARYEHQRHQNNLRMHDYEMQNIAAGPWHPTSDPPPNGALCIIDDDTWAGDERWFIGRWKQGTAEHGGYWVTDDGLYSANKDTKRWAEIRRPNGESDEHQQCQ